MGHRILFATDHDGARIAYAVLGAGPPLIIVPGWVSHLILCGTYARGARVARPDVQETLISLVRNSWGLGSELFADLFMREEAEHGATHAELARFQRESATAETAASILQQLYSVDVTELLGRVWDLERSGRYIQSTR